MSSMEAEVSLQSYTLGQQPYVQFYAQGFGG